MPDPGGSAGRRAGRPGGSATRCLALIFAIGIALSDGAMQGQVAQPPSTASPVQSPQQRLLLDASSRLGAGDFVGAREKLDEAIALARAAGDISTEAVATRGLGLVYVNQRDYARARTAFDAALALFRRVDDRRGMARTNESLGELAWTMSQWGDIRRFYTAAADDYAAVGDRASQAMALRAASFDITLTSADEEVLLQRAWDIQRPLGEPRGEGLILHQWGDLRWKTGDYAASLEKLEAAAERLERAGTPLDRSLVATSLGRTYRSHGQPEMALPYYRKALAIQEALGDSRAISQSQVAIALAYANLNQFATALEWMNRSMASARAAGPGVDLTNKTLQLAWIHLQASHYVETVALIEPMLSVPSPQLNSLDEAGLRSALGEAYAAIGRLADADREVTRAIELSEADVLPPMTMRALMVRTRVRVRLGDIAGARADCDRALVMLEQLRAKAAPLDILKQDFTDAARDFFTTAIGLDIDTGHAAHALVVAEQARARAFQDLLAGRVLAASPGAPAPGATPPAALSSTAVTDAVTIDDLKAVAARLDSPVIEYWVAPHETFAWLMTPSGAVTARRIPVESARLTTLIQGASIGPAGSSTRGPIEASRQTGASSSGRERRELFDLLIKPMHAALDALGASRLTIVPHGPLFRLSFAALTDAGGRYLIERYDLAYTPAAGVLRFTEQNLQHRGAAGALLVADPDTPQAADVGALARLAGARREVRDAADALGPNTTVLVGAQATEARVRELSSGPAVIHFATHAIVPDYDPLGGYLVLASAGADGRTDGRLTAAEIYRLTLSADLVVLSACRSGGGRVSGDGIIGLTRGFFYAGAPSVIATLWDVSDEPTAYLMRRFYLHRQQGQNKSRALRSAQLDLIRTLRAGSLVVTTPFGKVALREHPSLWAPFVLLGES